MATPLEQLLSEMTARLVALTDQVNLLTTRFETLDKYHSDKIASIEDTLDNVGITGIEDRIERAMRRAEDARDDASDVDSRVDRLNDNVRDLDYRLDRMDSRIDGLR